MLDWEGVGLAVVVARLRSESLGFGKFCALIRVLQLSPAHDRSSRIRQSGFRAQWLHVSLKCSALHRHWGAFAK